MAQLTSQDLWAMYVQGIISAQGVPPSIGSNFILMGTTTVANLYTTGVGLGTNPTTQQALEQIFDLGDALLNPTGVYTPTAHSMFSDYATYIDNLEPQGGQLSPSVQAALVQDQAAVTKATNQYHTDLKAAFADYGTQGQMFPGRWAKFQDFVNTASWGPTLGNDQSAVDGANAQLSTDMTNAYGQNYAAIANAKSLVDQVRRDLVASAPTTPAEMLTSTDSGPYVRPSYVPSSLAAFSDWANSNAVGPAHKMPPSVNISLQQGAATYDFSQSSYFSNTSWNEDFFFFSVGGSSSDSRQALNIDTASSAFKVVITMQGITTVGINRGPWYDSSLMYAFGNPKSLAVPFGPNALVIGMMPTITVYFDANSFQLAQSKCQSSGSINVGPFTASSGSSSSSLNASWDSTNNSLTINQNQVQPIILGCQVTVPAATPAAPLARRVASGRAVRLPISPAFQRT